MDLIELGFSLVVVAAAVVSADMNGMVMPGSGSSSASNRIIGITVLLIAMIVVMSIIRRL